MCSVATDKGEYKAFSNVGVDLGSMLIVDYRRMHKARPNLRLGTGTTGYG